MDLDKPNSNEHKAGSDEYKPTYRICAKLSNLSNLMRSIINYNKDPSQFDIWINDHNEINKFEAESSLSALHIAILEMNNHKSIDLIKRLLDAGEKLNQSSVDYYTHSHAMAFVHNIKDNDLMESVIRLLISYDKILNISTYGNHTLMMVVREDNTDIDKVKTLLKMKICNKDDMKYIVRTCIKMQKYKIVDLILNSYDDNCLIDSYDNNDCMIRFLYWKIQKMNDKIEILEHDLSLKKCIQDGIPPIESMIIDYAKQ
jgi:hypothetical protein